MKLKQPSMLSSRGPRPANRQQYLRVQASELALKQPAAALRLLERYFSLGAFVDDAQAHCDRATALIASDRPEAAAAAFEEALATERANPHAMTGARTAFSFLVATRRLRDRYARALELLDGGSTAPPSPLAVFENAAARALIAADSGEAAEAKLQAQRALDAADLTRGNDLLLVPAGYAQRLREELALRGIELDA